VPSLRSRGTGGGCACTAPRTCIVLRSRKHRRHYVPALLRARWVRFRAGHSPTINGARVILVPSFSAAVNSTREYRSPMSVSSTGPTMAVT
jgi:hypothetical protein